MKLDILRRKIAVAVLMLGPLAALAPVAPTPAAAAGNPIVTENQQPGTDAWLIGPQQGDDGTGQIKGYASATSVLQNQSLTLYVTVNPVQTYTIDVYRIGWYNGAGSRLRLHDGPLQGTQQSPCPVDATTGLIACGWSPSYTLTIPSDWTTGIYMALLTNAAGYQNYIIFVVRDGRPAAFRYQQSVSTYEAYNNYPNDGATGKSLYSFNSYGATTVSRETRAVKVSFDRPYSSNGSGQFFWWEADYVRWLERNGYDVTYSTDVDTHENGTALLSSKAFLAVGHDEYWSKEMFDAAQAAQAAGVNFGFFGADIASWQVRFEPSADGVADRVMVCYKDASIDPVQDATTTVHFRSAPVNRPEQLLRGVQFTSDINFATGVPYVVTNSSNWVYAGTGLNDGDSIPGIVGYEMDRVESEFPAPLSTSFTVLSQSPYTDVNGLADYSNSVIYRAPSGAWIFAAGTIAWGSALDTWNSNVTDTRVQQITANILNAFINGAPIVHHLTVSAPSTATAGQAATVTVTAENDHNNLVPGYNGTVHFSTSDTSTGVILPADATLTNGQGSFPVTLIKAGAQTLTVSDAANSLSTTVNLGVIAAPASKYAMSASTGTATAGTSFSVTLTALDPYGNTDTNYASRVHFTSTDPSPGVALPPDSTLTNGRGTFSVTLDKAGAQTVTATDSANSSISGRASLTILAAAAANLGLGPVPASVRTTQAFSVTVTLTDRFGNVANGYTGTVHFTSTDPLATLPANYKFTAGDAGRHTFSITLVTVTTPLTSQTFTVTDTANPSLNATSPPIAVTLV